MDMTKHLNARQLAKALAEIDAQIARMEYIVSDYEALGTLYPAAVPSYIYDAWNTAHDAVTALRMERDRIELNPRPIPAGEQCFAELVRQNID